MRRFYSFVAYYALYSKLRIPWNKTQFNLQEIIEVFAFRILL